MSLKLLLKRDFFITYSHDGFDPHSKTLNNLSYVHLNKKFTNPYRPDDYVPTYAHHPLTIVTTLLGMPNRSLKNPYQNGPNIFNNFIGWQKNASARKKMVNIICMPFTVLFNMMSIPFKMITNILKIGTEFLPLLLSDALMFIVAHIISKQNVERRNFFKTILIKLAIAPILLLVVGIRLVYYFTRCITSPFANVSEAWFHAHSQFQGRKADVAGVMLAGLAVLPSVVMYAALFPLAVKFLIPNVLPLLANYLSPLLVYAIQSLTPKMALIGGALTGLTLATVGTAIHKRLAHESRRWHSPSNKTTDQAIDENKCIINKIRSDVQVVHRLQENEEIPFYKIVDSDSEDSPTEESAKPVKIKYSKNKHSKSGISFFTPPSKSGLLQQTHSCNLKSSF